MICPVVAGQWHFHGSINILVEKDAWFMVEALIVNIELDN